MFTGFENGILLPGWHVHGRINEFSGMKSDLPVSDNQIRPRLDRREITRDWLHVEQPGQVIAFDGHARHLGKAIHSWLELQHLLEGFGVWGLGFGV